MQVHAAVVPASIAAVCCSCHCSHHSAVVSAFLAAANTDAIRVAMLTVNALFNLVLFTSDIAVVIEGFVVAVNADFGCTYTCTRQLYYELLLI